jgi:regulator of protease activity HflC (stomatin/prohibitin superfamily)
MSLDDLLTQDRRNFERSCRAVLDQHVSDLDLGIEVVDLTVLELHPPRTVVEAYRDVANALEDEQRWINEAQAVYASRLLDAAGERAVQVLTASAEDSDGAGTTGDVSNWKLTDALWQRLLESDAEGHTRLSGEAAATLNDAAQERTRQTEEARAATARFESLLKTFRASPNLTSQQLLWQALEDVLSRRALTIVDPQAAGSQRLLLGNPGVPASAASGLFDSSMRGRSPETRDNLDRRPAPEP